MSYFLRDSLSGTESLQESARGQISRARLILGVVLAGLIALLIFGPGPFRGENGPEAREIISQTPAGEVPDLDLKHHVALWSWYAAAANAVLATVLLLTAQFWARPSSLQPKAEDKEFMLERPAWWDLDWWFWATLAVILIGALFLRLPLAQKSLWWDEVWTLKNAVVGYEDKRIPSEMLTEDGTALEGGETKFREARWSKTFYKYDKPTNHVGFSVLSKASLSAWRALTGASETEFSELAFRMPTLIAGLLSLVAVALIFRPLSMPAAGLAVALFLAIHPWHIRYSVEGRGFGLILLFAPLAVLFLSKGFRQGTWSAWLGLGFSLFMMLWAFPYTIFLAGTIGVFLLGGLLLRYGLPVGEAFAVWARPVVAMIFAGMLYFQLIAPWIPQTATWGSSLMEDSTDRVTPELILNTWALTATGVPWQVSGGELVRELPSISQMLSAAPVVLMPVGFGILFGLLPLLFLAGAGLAFTLRTRGSYAISALLVAALPTVVIAAVFNHYFYERYLIFLLPAYALCSVLAVYRLSTGPNQQRPASGLLGSLAFIIITLAFSGPQIRLYLERPLAPLRDVAEFVSTYRSPDSEKEAIRAGFQHGGIVPAVYDPEMYWCVNRKDVEILMRKADTERRPLLIFYGHESFNRGMFSGEDYGQPFELLDDPALFEEVKRYEGVDAPSVYRVLSYKRKG